MTDNNAIVANNTVSSAHYDRITLANQYNSPLLRLPAELRTEIYAYICSTTTANIPPIDRLSFIRKHKKLQLTYSTCVVLLTTCRQVNREVFAMFFNLATFHMIYRLREVFDVVNSNARELITTVEVDVQELEYWARFWGHKDYLWVPLPSLKLLKVRLNRFDWKPSNLARLKVAAMKFSGPRGEEGIVEIIFKSFHE